MFMVIIIISQAEDSTGRILIARVMHGGAADRSGLISVGDEVSSVVMMLVVTMMLMVVMTMMVMVVMTMMVTMMMMMKLSLGVNLMVEAMEVQSQMVSNLLEMAPTYHPSPQISEHLTRV